MFLVLDLLKGLFCMSIRKKTLLLIAGVLLVFCAGILVLSRTVMLEGYLDLETRDMHQQVNRVKKSLKVYLDNMNTTAFDWAAWDDSYEFVETGNPNFIKTNLVDGTFNETGLRINFMFFFSNDQSVVFKKGYDWKDGKGVPAPQALLGHLDALGIGSGEPKQGFLVLPDGLYALVSRPIITSEETGPPRGQLVMGRRFDDAELKRLGHQLELQLALHPFDMARIPANLKDGYTHTASDSTAWVSPLNNEVVAGVLAIRDVYGQNNGLVEITKSREIFQKGESAAKSVLVAVAATGLLLSFILILVLERFVLAPLKGLREDIQKIGGLHDLSVRLNAPKQDEMGELANVMNDMLEKLDSNEREMIRLERLSALGEMAAGINHNLNNILVGVTVSSEFLLETVEDPKSREFIQTINRAGRQAAELVARLQDSVLGDSEEGVLQSVNAIIRDSIDAARTRWKDEAELKGISIDLILDLADNLPHIRGSSSGLYNIMLNLIFNAVDALPEGGELEIRSSKVGDGVQISIRDTGIGMDGETLKRVFEPFFTTKVEIGTGLGLATVYNTIVRWGGKIDVDSVEGAGSVFTIWLPTDAEEVNSEDVGVGVESPPGNILVVDDQTIVTELVEHVLTPMHRVSCLDNSERVMGALAQQEFDVLVLDLGMPGLPGDKIAKLVKTQTPQLALVLMTGWRLEDGDPRLSLFDFVLKKPLHDMQEVRDIVARAVNLAQDRQKELKAND